MPNYVLKIVIEGEDRASGAIKNVEGALGSIGKIAGGVAIGNLLSDGVKGLAGMAKGALDSYAAYEQLGKSINSLTAKEALLTGQASTLQQAMGQTAGKSKELLDWIQRLAIESPFRQEDVAGAFRLSLAFGFSTREAQRLTAAMVDFTTATGAGGETIERISRALGQIKTRGRLSMEELNQLAEGGVDALRILSDATGKTGKDLMDAITKGQIDANFAIQAILKDMEKMYAGAGKSAATSMSGLLSTLSEIKDTVGRDLLGGVFQSFQAPLAGLTTILTAPEFRAGVQQWGATLGQFSGDQIQGAADAMERINTAIQPLLNAKAPLWLAAIQGLAAAGGSEFKITITPKVTAITPPDGGWTLKVGATATSIEAASGEYLSVDTQAQTLTLAPGVNLPTLELQANITPEAQATITSVLDAAARGGAKGFGYELGVQSRLALQAQTAELGTALTAAGETAMSNLSAGLATWQPVISATATWVNDTPAKLFAMAAAPFAEPIMMAGSWLPGILSSLWDSVQAWFNSKPVQIRTQGYYTPSTSYTPSTTPLGWGSFTAPIDVNQPYPEYQEDPRYKASGDGFFYGGWAVVGEQGPELLKLPRGTQIFNNSDTKRMIPGFAGGTGTPIPDGWGLLVNALRAAGGWVDQKMGPVTRADAGRGAWVDFTQKGTQAMQTAADRTGAAFEDTAKKVNQTFESALQGVPGLFGTSQVTADDMRKSQLGLYQPKADEYLRQLSDEVMNGKEWGKNVDIKDAAARAGIDPNLPNDIILELVKEAWNNSSLFAEGKNLDLINTDAVKAAIEQQQKQLSGQASLKMLFGINDENLQAQSEALGQGLASVFGGASETDAVKGAGTALFAQTLTGFTDPATAAAGVKGMADSIVTATGTPENQAALYDAGEAGYDAYNRGWNAAASAAPIVPPGGGAGTTPPGTTPPGNALGTPFWRGGWTVAGEYGPELLNLPGGTSIYDAPTSQRMRRGGMRPMVVNQTFVVNDKLMAEQAAQRAVQLIRKGGR